MSQPLKRRPLLRREPVLLSQLKVLLIILVLSGASFWVLQRALHDAIIDQKSFTTLRNLWLGLTATAFLCGNFMLLMALTAGVMVWAQRKVPPVAAFLALLLVMPAFQGSISGIGPIQNLVEVHWLRVLSWSLLVPLWWQMRGGSKSVASEGTPLTDWLIIAAGLLQAALQFPVDSFTNTLRTGLYYFSDIYVPYWAMSRAVRNVQQLRMACSALVMGIGAICLVAMYESAKSWPLYNGLDEALGRYIPTVFLLRGGTGWYRASASAGHPLALGYLCCVAVLLMLALTQRHDKTKLPSLQAHWNRAALCLLAGGLLATMARGSWVGLLGGLLVWRLTDAAPIRSVFKAVFAGAAVLGLLSLTPAGESIINGLPFVGESDQTNVEYRQRLFEISWIVIQENPWFGTTNYLAHPLMHLLIQGEGIVDMVNSYVGHALSYGLVGLALFVGSFVWPMWQITRRVIGKSAAHPAAPVARALVASLFATMIIIATTSSVHAIPWVFWCLIGLSVSCVRILDTQPALTPSK